MRSPKATWSGEAPDGIGSGLAPAFGWIPSGGKGLADVELIVPSDATARIQECHQVMYHCLCKLIDPALKSGERK